MPIGDLAPEITVLITAVAVLLLAMILPQRRHGQCAALAIAGLATASVFAVFQFETVRFTFSGTFALDGATAWARLLILALTAACVGLAPRWFATDRRHGEFYAIMLFSALGAMVMAGASDLMLLVMGVLLSSVTGYVLAAYHRDWEISLEAGMKYFLIGALANALMVIGVILLMGMAGTTDYAKLATSMPDAPLAVAGISLILVGLFFKLGALPAHTWVPDVAEGAPVPAAAFLTVIPKIAGAIALYRFVELVPEDVAPVRLLAAVVAAATMTLGNLSALWQNDVRRLIGWSSVSQTGYGLMAVAVAGRAPEALPALLAFMAVYGIGNLAAFAAIAEMRGRTALSDYSGLFQHNPIPIVILTLSFLSFVGIPPLAGFLGKLALFTAALDGGLGWLVIVAVANTVLSLFYYLRVIGPAVFAGKPTGQFDVLGGSTRLFLWLTGLTLLAMSALWSPFWSSLDRVLLPGL